MRIEILQYDNLSIIERAARISHKTDAVADNEQTAYHFIMSKLLPRGHLSPLEFAHVIILFEDVTRAFTHELVRHRMASFVQESTRYVTKVEAVNPVFNEYFDGQFVERLSNVYSKAIEILGKEEGRHLLPIGIKTRIIMKANLRELGHIIGLRTHTSASPEMQEVFNAVLNWFKENDLHYYYILKVLSEGTKEALMIYNPKKYLNNKQEDKNEIKY